MGVGIYFYAVSEAEVALIASLGQSADNDELYGLLEELPQVDCSHFQLPEDFARLCQLARQDNLEDLVEEEIYNDQICDRIVRIGPRFTEAIATLDESGQLRHLCTQALAHNRALLLQVVG